MGRYKKWGHILGDRGQETPAEGVRESLELGFCECTMDMWVDLHSVEGVDGGRGEEGRE